MKPISNLSDNLVNITDDDVCRTIRKNRGHQEKAEAVDTTNATPEEKKALQDIIDKCDRLLKKIEENKNKTNPPQTGDTNNMPLWIALLFASGSVLTTLSVNKKRQKSSEK